MKTRLPPSGTLTADRPTGKDLDTWRLYDPNYQIDPCDPAQRDDPNVFETDPNLTVTVVMNQDRQIAAVFECGTGLEPFIPLLGVGFLGGFWLLRRLRLYFV